MCCCVITPLHGNVTGTEYQNQMIFSFARIVLQIPSVSLEFDRNLCRKPCILNTDDAQYHNGIGVHASRTGIPRRVSPSHE